MTESPDRDQRPPVSRRTGELRETLNDWRKAGEQIALVPTMGALHKGHLALVTEARRRADRAVVTIFVNPAQFAPTEDLATYPRREAEDLEKLGGAGVDLVFAPPIDDIYPAGFATSVAVAGPALGLESDFRPHFFTGVATVVTRLLIGALPDVAIFGEKDYQQLQVIRRLVDDLALPTEIVGYPTVREPDGLACSSRNAYLSEPERKLAPQLYAGLQRTAELLRGGAGERDALAAGRQIIETAGFRIDYLALRNADTLQNVTSVRREKLRLLAAARLGTTRLIDNVPV